MFVEIFSICDAATDYGGRLNILGTMEGLAAPSAPVTRERCSVAIRLRFLSEESGQHTVAVRFIDKEGNQPMPEIVANVNVKVQAGRASAALNLVLNLNRLVLPAFGLYEIQLRIDGVQQSAVPLLVTQSKERNRLRNPMEN